MSTLVEIAGFVCAVVFGFLFGVKAGMASAAGALLIVGYSLEGARVDLRAAKARQQDKWRGHRARRQARHDARARRRALPKE